MPSIEAAQLIGIPLNYDISLGGWVPQVSTNGTTPIHGAYICGDGAGIRGAAAAEIHGEIVGHTVAKHLGEPTSLNINALMKKYKTATRFGTAMTSLSIPRAGLMAVTTDDTIICRCESLTRKHIQEEINTGAMSTNAIKSGIRAGMGPCGGKFCQTIVNSIAATAIGCDRAEICLPTPRPPLRPIPVSTLADGFKYSDLPIQKPSPL